MHARFAAELPAARHVAIDHYTPLQQRGIGCNNTTSVEDCLILYLLIRYFNRKNVFEIGTFIGTTAVVMNSAARKNGGNCTTTDPHDVGTLPPESGIRFINGPAECGLQALMHEGELIDFIFADWQFDPEAIELASRILTDDAIIAVHDYFPGDKGEDNVKRLNTSYCRSRPGRWYLPTKTPWPMADGIGINICTAFFIPFSAQPITGSGTQ